MKVTVKFDEAAGMTPAQVKVQQSEAARKREYERKWLQCDRLHVVRDVRLPLVDGGLGFATIGDVLAKGGAR